MSHRSQILLGLLARAKQTQAAFNIRISKTCFWGQFTTVYLFSVLDT